jgi:hypothetical protein
MNTKTLKKYKTYNHEIDNLTSLLCELDINILDTILMDDNLTDIQRTILLKFYINELNGKPKKDDKPARGLHYFGKSSNIKVDRLVCKLNKIDINIILNVLWDVKLTKSQFYNLLQFYINEN